VVCRAINNDLHIDFNLQQINFIKLFILMNVSNK
jgi:hypothetical protein